MKKWEDYDLCIPAEILYAYKKGEVKDIREFVDIEQHLAECEVCRTRLKNIEKEIQEMGKFYEPYTPIKEPSSRKKGRKPKPKIGDIWSARGKEYFWQQDKIVLILNIIENAEEGEPLCYVVPLNDDIRIMTNLDVEIYSKSGLHFVAEAEEHGFIFINQLRNKLGKISSKELNYIKNMILFISGKDDIDISKIPHGFPIIDENDDPRINLIEERQKSLRQLFKPYRDYIEQQIYNDMEEDKEKEIYTNKANQTNYIPPQEIFINIRQPLAAASIGIGVISVISPSNNPIALLIKDLLKKSKDSYPLVLTDNYYIGLEERKNGIYLVHKGVDLVEYYKKGKKPKRVKNREVLLGDMKKVQNTIIRYTVNNETHEIIIKFKSL